MADRYLNVGKIVNTHGIKGEVKVISLTDSPEQRYQKGNLLYLYHPDRPDPLELFIEHVRTHKKFYLLKFEGYDDINDVEVFKGGMLKVQVDEDETLEEGEYYFYQIIGSDVYTTEGEKLGTIKDILQTGANDVWVVQPERGKKEILLPYIEDCIREIDIERKTVTVHLLEGLV